MYLPGGEDLVVVEGWQRSAEARGYINSLLKRNYRKQPGILEKATIIEQLQDPSFFYRLLLCGKSGVGKTSTINKLCGRNICSQHEETLGIQTSSLFWPTKLVSSEVIVLHIEFWDVGGRVVNKYDHILPTCLQSTDGFVFFFSFNDRHSWEELPSIISQSMGSDSTKVGIIIGTHADLTTRKVTQAEVQEFQDQNNIIILPIANVPGKVLEDGKTLDGRAGIEEVTPLMTYLGHCLITHHNQMKSTQRTPLNDALSTD